MGSSTKTITNVTSSKVFKDGLNLYRHSFNTFYQNTYDANITIDALINRGLDFLNIKWYKKFNFDINFKIKTYLTTFEKVEQYAIINYGADGLIKFFDKDDKNVDVSVVKYIDVVEEALNQYIDSEDTSKTSMKYTFYSGNDTFSKEYTLKYYKIDGDLCKIQTIQYNSDIIIPNCVENDEDSLFDCYVVLDVLDDNYNETGETKKIEIQLITDYLILINYLKSSQSLFKLELNGNIPKEEVEYDTIFIPLKTNGVLNNTDRNISIALNRLSMAKNKSLNSSEQIFNQLHNDDIKDCFVTYASKPFNVFWDWIIKRVYGKWFSEKGNSVVVTNGETTIRYEPRVVDNVNTLFIQVMDSDFIDVRTVNDEDEFQNFLILPTDFLKKQNIRVKYHFVNDNLAIFTYTKQVIKISFWQSIFMIFAGIVIGAITGQWWIGGALIASGAVSIISIYISPKIAAIAGILFSIYSIVSTGFTFTVKTISNVFNIIQNAYKIYVIDTIEALKKEIKEQLKENKKIERELAKIKSNFFIIDPYLMYDFSYSMYDNYYNVYNYYYDTFYENLLSEINLL